MNLKKLLAAATSVLTVSIAALIILLILTYAHPSDGGGFAEDVRQNLNYAESTENINNPDQGFYRPVYVRVTDGGADYNKGIISASTQLYHLRIDISAFSGAVNGVADKPLSESAVSGLEELLSFLNQNEKSAVVRFAYDPFYGGEKNKESELQTMLNHIKQVCPVLNRFQTAITAIEAGMIGPWGEMHSSSIADAAHITPVLETFLSNTEDIPVLARTPKMIYDYLGITVNQIENYAVSSTDKAYRLGIYNDGYLGSQTDVGTYTNREKEVEFLSKQTAHLPYGGEVVVPDSSLHDIDKCLPEMFKMHLSYLNIEWNNKVIEKWKNTNYTSACGNENLYFGKTAFNYIENRMGYRFVLTESLFNCSGSKLKISLTIKNVGFGNLNKQKQTKLLFVNEDGEVALTRQAENFTGCSSVNYETDLTLKNGKYAVYLCIYGGETAGKPHYALQFANNEIWNDALKANKIGEIEITKNISAV